MHPRTNRHAPPGGHSRGLRVRLLAALGALALLAAACGGTDSDSSSEGGGDSSSLSTAFVADMQVPDPDIFYETEGNQVIMSTYEGLVRYQQDPPTNDIEPLLAESWEVSPDGLTYTFTLRPDVTFVDGTPVDSAAAQASFERRTAVGEGPSYMLEQVESYETPDDLTFVVNLAQPVSAFMDYMAAPYGPKLVSPAVIEAEEVDGDLAKGYLETHSAGTGAYFIDSFELGQRYVLEVNPEYWGDAPAIDEIVINIIPDLSTQQVQLEGGDLDILHNLPASTTNSFEGKDGFQVIAVPSIQMQVVKVNPNIAPFDDLAVREAFRAAIDKEALTEEVFGDLGEPSTQMAPAGVLPEGSASDTWEYDPSLLADIAADVPDKQVTISYAAGLVNDQRTAEAIAGILNDAGFDAEVTPQPIAVIFGLRDADPDSVPNLLVETANPDAAHPDTYVRIFYNTEGFLNYLRGGDPAADAEMDRGLYTNDEAVVLEAYGNAGDILHDSATFLTIANVKGTFVATDSLEGVTSTASAPVSLNVQYATK